MSNPASKPTLRIIQPGMLTTVQDKGRFGYQRFGMPVAGAMDAFALRAANLLVGNPDNAAALEATVLGPQIRFLAETRIAITGAAVAPLLDREPIPMWQPVSVPQGAALTFRRPQDGMRAYLAVADGIDVPLVMGSRSTYIKAAIGGLDGRQLKAGDTLSAFQAPPDALRANRRMPPHAVPAYGSEQTLRVILGPQHSAFTQRGIDTFLNSTYTVSIYSDRMGYRLDGPAIEHKDGADVISDGAPMGAVQVPGDGKPIALLADRGTTGGYTKIAAVITADLSKIAQAMPGSALKFSAVSIAEAHQALRQQQAILDAIAQPPPAASIAVVVDGKVFDILNDRGAPLTLPTQSAAAAHTERGAARIGDAQFEFEITTKRLDPPQEQQCLTSE